MFLLRVHSSFAFPRPRRHSLIMRAVQQRLGPKQFPNMLCVTRLPPSNGTWRPGRGYTVWGWPFFGFFYLFLTTKQEQRKRARVQYAMAWWQRASEASKKKRLRQYRVGFSLYGTVWNRSRCLLYGIVLELVRIGSNTVSAIQQAQSV